MNIAQMFPSPYVVAGDLMEKDGKFKEVTLTVARVVKEKIQKKSGSDDDDRVSNEPEEHMAFMYFEKARKPLGLNRTNAEAMALLTGSRDSDAWVGKRVTLSVRLDGFPTRDEHGNKTKEPAVRIIGSPDLKDARSKKIKRGRKNLNIAIAPTKESKAVIPEEPVPEPAAVVPQP